MSTVTQVFDNFDTDIGQPVHRGKPIYPCIFFRYFFYPVCVSIL